MEKLKAYLEQRIALSLEDLNLLQKVFISIEMPAKSIFIQDGKIERYLYFLIEGIVKGYKNVNGKIVIEHLVEKNNFFTSIEGFINETLSTDYFETITGCKLYKISKVNFDILKQSGRKWSEFIESVTNESLSCKMERIKDFQMLTAKERYLKFLKQTPDLALNVSVENIASFLGMEPQSLSRIRKQVTF